MNNRGHGGQNVWAATLNMGVGLAQLTSSGNQRDTTWVGGGGSHRIVLQANLGEEAQPQSISQQDLGQPCWSASSWAEQRQHAGIWLSGSMFFYATQVWKEKPV